MDLQVVTVIGVIPGDEISKIKGYRQVESFWYVSFRNYRKGKIIFPLPYLYFSLCSVAFNALS